MGMTYIYSEKYSSIALVTVNSIAVPNFIWERNTD